MKVGFRVLCAVATAVLLAIVFVCRRSAERATAGDPVREVRVELANRTVAVRGFPEWGSTNQSPTLRGTLPYVVVCAEPADKTLRLAIEATGARVIGVLPPNAFQVEASGESLRKISADSRFAAATEFLPMDKVDERLAAALRGGADAVEVSVVSLLAEDQKLVREYVTSRGGEMLKGCLNGRDSFRARISAALVGELAKRGDVRWMEPFVRPKLFNDLAVEPAAMNVRETWNVHGLSGTNQVVSTSDSGIDTGDVETMHRDLADRVCGIGVVEGCYSEDVNGHGTHTAGSIVGNGTMSDGEIRGTAWGAKLWAWFCNGTDGGIYTPVDYDDLFRPDQANWPAFIHSASWGTDTSGQYDSQCADVDWYVWEHPDFLPVFANGNAGSRERTVGSPAAAKNVLAVGATQNARSGTFYDRYPSGSPSETAGYSSRGPCRDGRIKPDVAAPGTGILSTRAYGCAYACGFGANTNYAYECGTSMATPLTAGAVALVREWLVDRCGFTNVTPTAALMKAVITGGAKGASVPNNNQGWGRVDLEETLFPSNRAVKLIDRIPFDSGKSFTYLVETTNAAPLDVQLVWIDYPATSGGQQSLARLINDLDLKVTAVTNGVEATWFGNGGASADRLNTTESVRIGAAPAAVYRIEVSSVRITYDSLDGGAAALYVRGAFDPEAVEGPDLVTLSVSVEAGAAQAEVRPFCGVTKVEKGSTVVFSAPEWAYQYSDYGTAFARQAYLGFVGTGDAPISGSEREFNVIVSNDTAVVWRYDKRVSDYLFTYCAYLERVPDDDYDPYVYSAWMTNGATFSLSFPEEAVLGEAFTYQGYYQGPGARYPRWGTYGFRLGAVAYAQTDGAWYYLLSEENGEMWRSVDITMDEGIDLWCCYVNETEQSSGGFPYWWYLRYLWGGEKNLGYDGSATGDPDGDGFDNAAEYADETDPVDDKSFRFRIDRFSPTEMIFTGSVKGSLVVERSDRPGGDWKEVQTIAQPRASTVNSVQLDSSSNGFYRVIYRE